MSSITLLHRQWSRADQRARAAEGLARLGCGGVVLAALHGLLALPMPALGGLGCGLLAMEGARLWRARRRPADIAAHIDRVAQTGWLLQSALAAEAGDFLGDTLVAQAVVRRAERLAPRVAPLAVRPRRWPLPWLTAAALAAGLALLLPRLAPPGDSAELGGSLAVRGATRPDGDGLTEPLPEADAQDPLAPAGLGGASSAAGGAEAGNRRAGAASGGVGVQGAAPSTGQGSARDGSAGEQSGARLPGEGGKTAEDEPPAPEDAGERPRQEGAMGLDPGRGDGGAGGTPHNQPEYGGGGDGHGDDGQVWSPEAGAAADAEASGGQRVEASGASRLDAPSGDHGEPAVPGQSSSVMQMGPQAPTIASLEDDKIWDPITAGAGMGGENDAAATESSTTAGERDRVAVAEEWVESRWRAAPAGMVQAIEEGRAGGESQAAYEAVFVQYASIAEAAAADGTLPPGRRDYIRRYFEAIRPASATTDTTAATTTDGAGAE